ncbi:MAG: type II toxin-antitoxin system Phd/YefM family antitoxin [Deltaproteobacteria bacterium]|nr:type II toxin-antitoxin system Phd/YefM family antitoxin [Deltaproteobacteria bacterium]
MATLVEITEAETHLSRLLERAAAGEEIIILDANVPVARLVPIRPAPSRRVPGRLAGQLRLADDFDDPLADLEAAIDQGPIEPLASR